MGIGNKIAGLVLLSILGSCQSARVGKQVNTKFTFDGYIKFEALVNDSIKGKFIYDTGASGLLLDSAFVSDKQKLIREIDTARIGGAGNRGYRKIKMIRNSLNISLGLHHVSFDSIPILNLEAVSNEKIAGLVGNNFINGGVLHISNTNLTLRIDTLANSEKYETCIPFEFERERIFIRPKVQLKGGTIIEPRLMIDLGCTDIMILNTPYYNKIRGHISDVIDYTILDAGVSGNSDGGEFRANQIQFAGYLIPQPVVSFSKDLHGAHSNTYYDGLIGNELMSRFDYAIDFKNEKLYLKSRRGYQRPFKSTVSGIYAIKDGDFAIVKCAYRQFAPYIDGLNIGDTIVSINNQPISKLSQKVFDRKFGKDNEELRIEFKKNGISRYVKYRKGQKI
jgi:hypothetical protein